MLKPCFAALVFGLALNLGTTAFAHDPHTPHALDLRKRIIPVTASAEIKTAPDEAIITAGVLTEGRDATDTGQENARKMNIVFEALRQAGVNRTDINTSQLTLRPRYDYESRKKPRIVGYTADNSVTVKTYDLEKVSPIVDALIRAGANNIQNVRFGLRDPEAAEALVLEQAIKKARERAQLIATSAGVSLGLLQSVKIEDGRYSPYNRSVDEIIVTAKKRGVNSEPTPPSTPINRGELTVRATVNLVYEMR